MVIYCVIIDMHSKRLFTSVISECNNSNEHRWSGEQEALKTQTNSKTSTAFYFNFTTELLDWHSSLASWTKKQYSLLRNQRIS